MKTLKRWNGRWKRNGTVYIAAYSVADAVRLGQEAASKSAGWRAVTAYEIRKYWSGTWGNAMKGT